jgi:hypothetical protein
MLCTVTYASYVLIVQWREDTNFAGQFFNQESIICVSIHDAVFHSRCCSKEITINPAFLKKKNRKEHISSYSTARVEVKVQSPHSRTVLFQFQHLRLYSIMTKKGSGRKQSCPKVPNHHLLGVTEESWCHR